MEPENHEGQMLSPYVPPPPLVAALDKFPKFVPLMENLVAIIDTYTYEYESKKVSQRIVTKIKIKEYLEEEVTEQHVLIENTSTELVAIVAVN